jgi:hypothetical protein
MVKQVIALRLLVGYLGERKQSAWWNTEFLSSAGLRFLERDFPRTAVSAALHSVRVAAKCLYDDPLGQLRGAFAYTLWLNCLAGSVSPCRRTDCITVLHPLKTNECF